MKKIGAIGFEPTASWSRTRRATRLRHAPNESTIYPAIEPSTTEINHFFLGAGVLACFESGWSASPITSTRVTFWLACVTRTTMPARI